MTAGRLRRLGRSGQSNFLFCKEEEGRSDGVANGLHVAFLLQEVQAGGGAIAPEWAFSAVGGGVAGTFATECPV